MITIKMELSGLNNGALGLYEDDVKKGEMLLSIDPEKKELIVYHTEVAPESAGKGYAGQLLEHLVQYARDNDFKIIPLCPYVHAQFKRHPELYQDVWKRPTIKG